VNLWAQEMLRMQRREFLRLKSERQQLEVRAKEMRAREETLLRELSELR